MVPSKQKCTALPNGRSLIIKRDDGVEWLRSRRRDVRPNQHRHCHNSVILFGTRFSLPEVYQSQWIEVRSEFDFKWPDTFKRYTSKRLPPLKLHTENGSYSHEAARPGISCKHST